MSTISLVFFVLAAISIGVTVGILMAQRRKAKALAESKKRRRK